jgi:uncharacterized protein (DUF2062 family)
MRYHSYSTVFLGLTFVLQPSEIIMDLSIAAVLSAVLLGSRFVSVSIATFHSPILSANRPEITLLSAQGVTQATLAIIAFNAGIPLGALFLSIVAYVIILTNLITTIGAIWARRRKKFGFKEFTEGLQEVKEPMPIGSQPQTLET